MEVLHALRNWQIGEIFGGLTYSAAARIHKRFSEKTEKDRALKAKLTALASNMSDVNGGPQFASVTDQPYSICRLLLPLII